MTWLFVQWIGYLGAALLLGLWMGWMLWRRPGRAARHSIELELAALREQRAALRLRLTDAERRSRPVPPVDRLELDLRDRIDLADDQFEKRRR